MGAGSLPAGFGAQAVSRLLSVPLPPPRCHLPLSSSPPLPPPPWAFRPLSLEDAAAAAPACRTVGSRSRSQLFPPFSHLLFSLGCFSQGFKPSPFVPLLPCLPFLILCFLPCFPPPPLLSSLHIPPPCLYRMEKNLHRQNRPQPPPLSLFPSAFGSLLLGHRMGGWLGILRLEGSWSPCL